MGDRAVSAKRRLLTGTRLRRRDKNKAKTKKDQKKRIKNTY